MPPRRFLCSGRGGGRTVLSLLQEATSGFRMQMSSPVIGALWNDCANGSKMASSACSAGGVTNVSTGKITHNHGLWVGGCQGFLRHEQERAWADKKKTDTTGRKPGFWCERSSFLGAEVDWFVRCWCECGATFSRRGGGTGCLKNRKKKTPLPWKPQL